MIEPRYHDELEAKQHEEAMNRLCEEFPDQQEFIRKNYLETLDPLIVDASIRTYLPIFVSRQVKARLQKAS